MRELCAHVGVSIEWESVDICCVELGGITRRFSAKLTQSNIDFYAKREPSMNCGKFPSHDFSFPLKIQCWRDIAYSIVWMARKIRRVKKIPSSNTTAIIDDSKASVGGMKGENFRAGKVRKIVIVAFRNYWWFLPLRQAGWRGIGGKKNVMKQSRVIDTRFSFDFHSESRYRAGKTRQRRALCVSMEIKHKSRDLSDKCWEYFFSQKALNKPYQEWIWISKRDNRTNIF